jgi:hypothetical protein
MRTSKSTVTAGGLIQRSIYFTEEEWRAVTESAFMQGRSASDVVREAVRAHLKLGGR